MGLSTASQLSLLFNFQCIHWHSLAPLSQGFACQLTDECLDILAQVAILSQPFPKGSVDVAILSLKEERTFHGDVRWSV